MIFIARKLSIGVFSGCFCLNRKAAWNARKPLIIYKKKYKTLQFKYHLLPTRKKKFKTYRMITNTEKTSNVVCFLPSLIWAPVLYTVSHFIWEHTWYKHALLYHRNFFSYSPMWREKAQIHWSSDMYHTS